MKEYRRHGARCRCSSLTCRGSNIDQDLARVLQRAEVPVIHGKRKRHLLGFEGTQRNRDRLQWNGGAIEINAAVERKQHVRTLAIVKSNRENGDLQAEHRARRRKVRPRSIEGRAWFGWTGQ